MEKSLEFTNRPYLDCENPLKNYKKIKGIKYFDNYSDAFNYLKLQNSEIIFDEHYTSCLCGGTLQVLEGYRENYSLIELVKVKTCC